MKNVRLTFEDEEFETMKKAKGEMSWHDYMLESAKKKLAEGNGKQKC